MLELGLLIFISAVTLSYTIHKSAVMLCRAFMDAEITRSFSMWMRDGFDGLPDDIKKEFEATRQELNKLKRQGFKPTTDEK